MVQSGLDCIVWIGMIQSGIGIVWYLWAVNSMHCFINVSVKKYPLFCRQEQMLRFSTTFRIVSRQESIDGGKREEEEH